MGREGRQIARPFIPWIGGKEKLAPYIRQVLPPNPKVYVEPFGGSGAILLGLPHNSSRLDIYNDANRDLVNLFLCVKYRLLALLQELNYLPLHSRVEFDFLKSCIQHEALELTMDVLGSMEMDVAEEEFDPAEAEELVEILSGQAELFSVRRAAAYFRLSRGSFSGTTTSFGVKSCSLKGFFYLLRDASQRLQDVVIEHMDAAKLIHARDSPQTLFYCDPPYYDAESCYTALFSEDDHLRLYDAVKRSKGAVVISYNDCDFVRELYQGFYILAFQRNNPLAQQKDAKYGELIITNYDPRELAPQMDLFGTVGGMELVNTPK